MLRNVRVAILAGGAILSGCFVTPVRSTGIVETPDTALRITQPTYASPSKSVSSYNANSTAPTQLAGPSGNLSGSSITLPAGALALSVDLVVEESVPLNETSVAGSLNLPAELTVTPVGSGLIIRPTSDVNLTKPLLISMPLGVTSLALASGKNYAVFYKYFIEGELRAGVIPPSALTLNDKNQVTFDGYFGAYWLCETNIAVEQKAEVKTVEPLVNNNHVSVIEASGYVPEQIVAAKAIIPEVKWLNLSLTASTLARSVKLVGSVDIDHRVTGCTVDLSENIEGSSSVSVKIIGDLTYSYTVTDNAEHKFKGRFRCVDQEARSTVSPWSETAIIPAFVKSIVVPSATTSTPVKLAVSVSAPVLSPMPGTFAAAFNLTLSSVDSGATIYYTLDGSLPSTASSVYTGPISIASNVDVRAMAVKDGVASQHAAGAYTIAVAQVQVQAQLNAPTATQATNTYPYPINVYVYAETGATIYYTTDGTTPTTTSPIYTSGVYIPSSMTLKVMAARAGMTNSLVSTYIYTITGTVDPVNIYPGGGNYATSQMVTLSTTTTGATIRYTVDGSTPNSTSTIYTGPFLVDHDLTVYAIAEKSGYLSSYPNGAAYDVPPPVDPDAPTVTALTFDSPYFDTRYSAQVVGLNITIEDSTALPGNGFNNFDLFLTNGTQNIYFYGYTSEALAGSTATSRTFHVSRNVPFNSAPGVWSVQNLTLYDGGSHNVTFSAAELSAKGFATSISNDAPTGDTTPPVVQSLTFSKAAVYTGSDFDTIDLTIHLTDNYKLADVGGLTYEVHLRGPGGAGPVSFISYATSADAANATDRTITVTGTFPMGSALGNWVIDYIWIYDSLNNYEFYSGYSLTSHGLDRIIVNLP